MDLRIDTPLALLLLIPLVAYFLWTWWRHRDQLKKNQQIVFGIRILAVVLLVFAICSPYLLLPVKEEQVVYLIDRSASLDGVEDQAISFIEEGLKAKNENHHVGIYSFASNLQTESMLTDTLEHVPELSDMTNRGETNIAQAIQLATGIVDLKKATRIVLLTDGLETKGNAQEQLTKLTESNVSIDVVQLSQNVAADVSVQSFTTPQVAYAGEQQQLVTEIKSTMATQGELYLYENDQLIHQKPVQLEEGANVFTYRYVGHAEGLVKYEALVQVDEDAIIENNKLTSVTMVQSTPRVLIVSDRVEGSSIASAIGTNAVNYDVKASSELPSSLSSFLNYNAIIFDNIPGHLVGEEKMGVIEQAVKNFGVGFMMVGGENSFGLGGYFKTPIEALLPVEMEVKGKQQLPSLGLVIVLDRSGSMMGPKIELAKEAAARSVELLRDGDTLGFIAFDDRPWEVIETAPLTDKEKAVNTVLSIPPGGGTEIFTSLELAYENLTDLQLQRKHIILLTDGQSYTASSYEDLIEAGKENNITLSTVAIGADADGALLESLSEWGSGRFYSVLDETTIPSILSRETAMISRTYIEDNPFYPTIYNAEGWNALFENGVPQMNAYIGTTAKQTAMVIAESEKEDPVLAEWQYGLGRTIAFTSDSTGAWTGDWARWEEWPNFWQTAISRMLPTYNEIAYDIRLDAQGSFVITDPTNQAAFLDIAAVNEFGEELEVQLDPVSASKVKATLEAEPGLVFFRITSGDGTIYQAGQTIPYSEEFELHPPNEPLLTQITERTGGLLLEEPEQAFREFTMKGAEKQSITLWLVLASMLLFFIDITIRRFGWGFLQTVGKVKKTPEQPKSQEETNVGQILKEMKRK
ncbi:VWA domain-containing protein [Ureibacillus chungkukjangi]|uniref:von Willebrand factor type A domain-containing protein n=1 Tax=Ureibacillus chungkukjangi TaxID=1202712 RepID=A0A318TGP9_9BACL|nr:VWA domain-containing protein [Ureibacillus chungkukjangi]MCM3390510.1 VWA domain-containing protein [Ureibacillus chungkukjangi]PYF02318.1 von Willebrand factor type A domain-containing protein [Ureibacillus chungkukjangi]